MNKLKKPDHETARDGRSTPTANVPNNAQVASSSRAQSRTMMYAQSALVPASGSYRSQATTSVKTALNFPPSVKPTTTAERYWAARALTAETLLSARVDHQGELLALSTAEEEKRAREIALLQRRHEERYMRLELLVVFLVCCLVATVAAIVHSHSSLHHHTATGWSIPTHFTIPILSPFTSVVEHETSTLNTRLVTASAAILAVLAYACFRYWMIHGHKR
ncbi:uncharacterized protein C8Q71DRAFT_766143 [Rhodofomes roseus]|uniref:Transmembrane protein n=1 Tax=Rhodofomes roseus TaxID=34475 RepID=A0ABQ8KB09_9APHY|nr:uncharacterized protein C8Q71DRAFT_766143 [Rhodofomes roseus]KAH9834741.1 hypothetical protein C8Q71DRAFT_766143 [Rhodofomes roseus]